MQFVYWSWGGLPIERRSNRLIYPCAVSEQSTISTLNWGRPICPVDVPWWVLAYGGGLRSWVSLPMLKKCPESCVYTVFEWAAYWFLFCELGAVVDHGKDRPGVNNHLGWWAFHWCCWRRWFQQFWCTWVAHFSSIFGRILVILNKDGGWEL